MKNKGFAKILIILTVIMGVLTVALLWIQAQQRKNNVYIEVNPDTMKLVQLEAPKDGDRIAIVDTTLGEFRFVLYPEHSPKAVENFISLAESGYYDNTYVFNSDSGAFFAAGSKEKNGEIADSAADYEHVERELHQDLWPFKGAVCVLNTTVERTTKEKILGGGKYYNGSRFTVVNTLEFDENQKKSLLAASSSKILGEAFIEKGGIPNYSQQLTVIGQTYEGLDVVEKLSSLDADNSGIYKVPKENIMINSVRIDSYTAEK